MPEDNENSRRKFLGIAMGGIFGAIAFGYIVPMAAYIIKPSLRRVESGWSDLGPLDALTAGVPASVAMTVVSREGWKEKEEKNNVWVVRGEGDNVTVFSPTCPHLGCGYNWDSARNEFVCPCHESMYTIDGKVTGGPAPRGLDTLPVKVEGGRLYVRWERFRLGISDKIEA
ncbi:MAG: ubiquinol-cytochrome c reductase iron-sulfur subunit [Nitrospirae bacterium]|nr:ubiquinol-cytochrome c reductase iron-sulfur subunit [Nitrospirota bacterium]